MRDVKTACTRATCVENALQTKPYWTINTIKFLSCVVCLKGNRYKKYGLLFQSSPITSSPSKDGMLCEALVIVKLSQRLELNSKKKNTFPTYYSMLIAEKLNHNP